MASAKIKGIGGGPYDPRKVIAIGAIGIIVFLLVLSVIFDLFYVRALLGLRNATPLPWAQSQTEAPPNKAPSNPATTAPKQTARQGTTPAQRPAATLRATATREAPGRSLAQRLEEQALTRDEVNRLVAVLRSAYNAPAGHGTGGILLGQSGAKYHVYFNGDAMGPPDRAIGIQLLPTHLSAHLPTSGTNREAFLVWDWALDGAVNKGERGSPYAPTAEEDRYPFQSGISGRREIGLEHRTEYQLHYANAVRDILARRR